jgi:superfamily II DNA/RNA helicase
VITDTAFEKLEFINEKVRKAIAEMGHAHMTDIQLKAIPVVQEGGNVIIRSVTGSGKTLAYLVPLMSKLCAGGMNRGMGTTIIVVCPTRELAM